MRYGIYRYYFLELLIFYTFRLYFPFFLTGIVFIFYNFLSFFILNILLVLFLIHFYIEKVALRKLLSEV